LLKHQRVMNALMQWASTNTIHMKLLAIMHVLGKSQPSKTKPTRV
jgi:hypothetical protein